MPSTHDLIRARVDRFVTERIRPAIHRDARPLRIEAWEVPGEPVPFAEAVTQTYSPFTTGRPWGKPWGTVWFHLTGSVPTEWSAEAGARAELAIDLGFLGGMSGFQAEGLVFAPDGRIVKAIEPLNQHVPISGGEIDVYVEAAANPDVGSDWKFQPTLVGDLATAGDAPLYVLRRADVALLDETVWELDRDVWTLTGLLDQLPPESTRAASIRRALETMVDRMDPDDVAGTAQTGRDALSAVLAAPASATAHRVVAVGHAHIDSAWLWPVRETIRKCARTFSNVLNLMDDDPDFVFACSSAQQYAWMKEHYPDLFARIAERVREGRFVPVGGMWVESDTNLPGSEALVRQLVAGKGFFLREFGVEPVDVWLPDSFGYTAALPQIVRAAGSLYFLTQKPSWNETNRMPHHTFQWEGIDGSRVFTHFPPVDTYNSKLSGAELAKAERQFTQKGATNVSLVPFGFGDGGGGPTREMLAAAARTRSLEGSPTVRIDAPRAFFEEAEAELEKPPVWSGEIYLEFHRGTYTSQARTKRGNRRSEHLLREAELWAATATIRTGADYPYQVLEKCWHIVLLQQFHDILPGTSIAWVYQVAEENYRRVAEQLERLIGDALEQLGGPAASARVVFNASPFEVEGVPAFAAGAPTPAGKVSVERDGDAIVLQNAAVRVTIDGDGLISSLIDRASGRDAIPPGQPANLPQLFRDTPTQWDAWDLDEHYSRNRTDLSAADEVTLSKEDASLAAVTVRRSFGDSRLEQTISLTGSSHTVDIETTVHWHEKQKLLKLAFPLDLLADRATSEIQFGHIHRPTHVNTSWDAARFETSAHRWVHVGEPGFGVAIANDSTYGHDVTRATRPDGGSTTLVRQSLLRAPVFPDPTADQGTHVLRTSVRAGAGVLDAAREGYRINLPQRSAPGVEVEPLLRVDDAALVVEAIKLAEDRSGDLIVRLYEATGSRRQGSVSFGFAVSDVHQTDLLERQLDDPRALLGFADGTATIRLRAFEIVTLRVRRE